MALQRPLLPLLLGLAGALRGATSGKPFQRPPSSPALHSVSPPRLILGTPLPRRGQLGMQSVTLPRSLSQNSQDWRWSPQVWSLSLHLNVRDFLPPLSRESCVT